MPNVQVKIKRGNAPETTYNFTGLTDQQIVEYFSAMLRIAILEEQIRQMEEENERLEGAR